MAISGADGSIILTTKVDETGLKKGLGSMKELGATAGKAFLAIGAAAATATVAITKMSVSAYADYEQLVGGVETLFKGSAQKVLDYANDAFYTAGVSANEYMQQVTSFSASLLSSLSGDTDKAADIANMALIDISDNVNKMGSSMESVTLAYQGFAKEQYMLLDNLKLGYGGTKTEMERLLRDAQALTGVKYDINNLADVYSAIHAIQEELGITGTTAKEAEKTITGSANMMKAAWQNVLSAIAGGGDLDRAINNLVYSVQKYFENIVPVVERSLQGIGQTIERIAPMLVQTVARSLIKAIPSLSNAVYQMITGLAKGIYQGIIALFSGGAKKALQVQTNQIAESVKNQNDLTAAVEETNKALKGSTASFDEINTLTSVAEGNMSDFSDLSTPDSFANMGDIGSATDTIENTIDAKLMSIAGMLVGWGLVALGTILIFYGQIPLGIGAIVAGLATTFISAASLGDSVSPEVRALLTTMSILVGIFLIAVGIILLLTGVGIGFGVALILAGVAAEYSAVALNWNFVVDKVKQIFELLKTNALAGIGLVALGVIFIALGNPAIGLPLLASGLASLGYQANKSTNNSIVDKVKEIWGEVQKIWKDEVEPAFADFEQAWEDLQTTVEPIIDYLEKNVLQPFLAFLTGDFLDGIKRKVLFVVKTITNAISGFLKIVTGITTFISGVFSGDWKKAWNGVAKIFKSIINTWIGYFENAINFILSGLGLFFKRFSALSSIIKSVTGVDLNVSLNSYSVKLPRLAQGAVIPPNREFLAVLGDQKHGTNIEAPLDTIKQAVVEVLAQVNVGSSGYNGRIEVPVIIDGREIARAVREAEGNMGKQTVFGGFANVY